MLPSRLLVLIFLPCSQGCRAWERCFSGAVKRTWASDLISLIIFFQLWSSGHVLERHHYSQVLTTGGNASEAAITQWEVFPLSSQLWSLLTALISYPMPPFQLVVFQLFCILRKSKVLAAFYCRLYYLENVFGVTSLRSLVSQITALFWSLIKPSSKGGSHWLFAVRWSSLGPQCKKHVECPFFPCKTCLRFL